MTFDEMTDDLFELTGPLAARPDVPLEAEEHFSRVVAAFEDRESCRRHLAEIVPRMFRCLSSRPDWIQGPDWPWFDGRPMVFAGSVEVPPGTFHDDGRFYVFWSPETGVTNCVIQVA